MDKVIFEEFKGTGNMELKLDRKIAERRVFPAVDVDAVRHPQGRAAAVARGVHDRVEAAPGAVRAGPQQAIELLMSQLRKTKSNYEFLVQVQKTTPTAPGMRSDD